eukprot:TRINITY_DN980_c0_g2_i1.p1 TRINITY_DN980_c0_g2~~TRINITY_DN980_c0_g2_i1.p1  ORF type:complete len:529 (+),score=52.22 TRINITY_DN980_c0_g2_i1:136-1722(+)
MQSELLAAPVSAAPSAATASMSTPAAHIVPDATSASGAAPASAAPFSAAAASMSAPAAHIVPDATSATGAAPASAAPPSAAATASLSASAAHIVPYATSASGAAPASAAPASGTASMSAPAAHIVPDSTSASGVAAPLVSHADSGCHFGCIDSCCVHGRPWWHKAIQEPDSVLFVTEDEIGWIVDPQAQKPSSCGADAPPPQPPAPAPPAGVWTSIASLPAAAASSCTKASADAPPPQLPAPAPPAGVWTSFANVLPAAAASSSTKASADAPPPQPPAPAPPAGDWASFAQYLPSPSSTLLFTSRHAADATATTATTVSSSPPEGVPCVDSSPPSSFASFGVPNGLFVKKPLSGARTGFLETQDRLEADFNSSQSISTATELAAARVEALQIRGPSPALRAYKRLLLREWQRKVGATTRLAPGDLACIREEGLWFSNSDESSASSSSSGNGSNQSSSSDDDLVFFRRRPAEPHGRRSVLGHGAHRAAARSRNSRMRLGEIAAELPAAECAWPSDSSHGGSRRSTTSTC